MEAWQHETDQALDNMWNDAIQEIDSIDPHKEKWKIQTLPLARVKKIMKSEEIILQELDRERQRESGATDTDTDGRSTPSKFMISAEGPLIMSRACELLIRELSTRAWQHTERNRRRTLQRQDIHAAVGESEVFDFLIDIVPRVTPSTRSMNFTPEDVVAQAMTNPGVAANSAVQIDQAMLFQPHMQQAVQQVIQQQQALPQLQQVSSPQNIQYQQQLLQQQQQQLPMQQQQEQQQQQLSGETLPTVVQQPQHMVLLQQPQDSTNAQLPQHLLHPLNDFNLQASLQQQQQQQQQMGYTQHPQYAALFSHIQGLSEDNSGSNVNNNTQQIQQQQQQHQSSQPTQQSNQSQNINQSSPSDQPWDV